MGKFEKKKVSKFHSKDPAQKKLIVAIAVFGTLLIMALVFLGVLLSKEPDDENTPPTTEATTEVTTEAASESTIPGTENTAVPNTTVAQTTQAVTENMPAETTQAVPETTAAPTTEAPKETTPMKPVYTPTPVTPTTPVVVIPEVTLPAKVVLSLPYTIPGTDLVVEKIASFDGVYLEDGSDSKISGVAMILVHNAGSMSVEYANISMKYDDVTLKFELSGLTPGARVACQELSKAGCSSADLVECTADVALLDAFSMASDQVSVTDNGNNTITVTNLTDQSITTVRVFYKYYMSDENTYLGGITFTAKISNLGAQESVVIRPSHYASGAAKVIMIRTYDEDV